MNTFTLRINFERVVMDFGLALILGLTLAACGGGGGSSPPPPDATVTSVSSGQVLSPGTGTAVMSFPVILSKAVINGVNVSVNTSASNTGPKGSLGLAVGGASCTSGVDYVTPPGSLTIPTGATTYNIPVTVCANTALSPDKTFNLTWASTGAVGGTVVGTIVNNQPGGLASTATSTGILGTPTFGRDNITPTNPNADGHLGLSYTQLTPSGTPPCTQDNVTGLVWQNLPALTPTYTYTNAQAYVNTINSSNPPCGKTWRLPTVNELESLVDFSISDSSKPAADATGFPYLQPAAYWTADMLEGTTTNAWYVDFGNQGATAYQNTGSLYRVILVSGNSAWDAAAKGTQATTCTTANSQYVDNKDGTVTDTGTQLMWMQCAMGQTGSSCSGTQTAYTSTSQMETDLNSVNQHQTTAGLGYSDWRIPTVKELNSLANRICTDNSNGAINVVAFPNNGALSYVSSTFYAVGSAGIIWAVDFSNGGISSVSPSTSGGRPMRLVRGGQ